MNKDMDAQFLCKDCARFNLCQYYDRRKEDSYICKYFHLSENQNKCGDLISRQAVLDVVEKAVTKEVARWSIKELPSVENKGEWIKIQSGDKDFPESIVCSKCKNENSHLDFNEHGEPIGKVFVTSKFCPNCGAKIRRSE